MCSIPYIYLTSKTNSTNSINQTYMAAHKLAQLYMYIKERTYVSEKQISKCVSKQNEHNRCIKLTEKKIKTYTSIPIPPNAL